jgi:hypothetical protein
MPTVGIIVNPMSGLDVRRLAARARREHPQDKQNQIARAVVGAAAAGVTRFLLVPDLFRTSESAVENIKVGAEFEFLDIGRLETRPADTARAVRAMREAGATALLVLGGDGTNRIVARAWPDAAIVPMSTGTNNVFPVMQEATISGASAGAIASGAVPLAEGALRAKIVHVEYSGGKRDLAVIDAVALADDRLGNLLPFNPEKLRCLVLARAEPAAVGMSPIGGLLQPCGFDDDFGVEVRCTRPETPGSTPLLTAVSPGLYRRAHIATARKLAFRERAVIEGPCLLAYDGDRTRVLEPGERAQLWVERSGPWVIDAVRTLRVAGQKGLFANRHFHDGFDQNGRGPICC